MNHSILNLDETEPKWITHLFFLHFFQTILQLCDWSSVSYVRAFFHFPPTYPNVQEWWRESNGPNSYRLEKCIMLSSRIYLLDLAIGEFWSTDAGVSFSWGLKMLNWWVNNYWITSYNKNTWWALIKYDKWSAK